MRDSFSALVSKSSIGNHKFTFVEWRSKTHCSIWIMYAVFVVVVVRILIEFHTKNPNATIWLKNGWPIVNRVWNWMVNSNCALCYIPFVQLNVSSIDSCYTDWSSKIHKTRPLHVIHTTFFSSFYFYIHFYICFTCILSKCNHNPIGSAMWRQFICSTRLYCSIQKMYHANMQQSNWLHRSQHNEHTNEICLCVCIPVALVVLLITNSNLYATSCFSYLLTQTRFDAFFSSLIVYLHNFLSKMVVF